MGEYQYSDWTKDDCKNLRPALACLIDMLQIRYPQEDVPILTHPLLLNLSNGSRSSF